MKILMGAGVEKNMIIYIKNRIKSLIIFSFLLFLSSMVYAKDEFKVEIKCNDKENEYCDVVKYLDDKKLFILENMRYPQVDKINGEVFHVYGSCGSPCQYHQFISRVNKDETSEFIALNKNNNCLIESDSNKKMIYARSLFNKKRKVISTLENKEFDEVPIDSYIYNSFQEKSYFDNEGRLHLVSMLADIDRDGNALYFNKIINKTCEK